MSASVAAPPHAAARQQRAALGDSSCALSACRMNRQRSSEMHDSSSTLAWGGGCS